MRSTSSRYLFLAVLLSACLGSTVVDAQTAPPNINPPAPRFLVYFHPFSAYLSPRAKTIIADAAGRARKLAAKGIIVQARTSAVGKPETNKYLAQTRSSIVADELEGDGIPRDMIRQEPIGQTGSDDRSVFNRRVDIILER
jgi:outer membrane protein OmpA-like peptidoglycan-associated protein